MAVSRTGKDCLPSTLGPQQHTLEHTGQACWWQRRARRLWSRTTGTLHEGARWPRRGVLSGCSRVFASAGSRKRTRSEDEGGEEVAVKEDVGVCMPQL